MEKLTIYKIKGYNNLLDKNFKILVGCYTFDEAWNLADKLVGPGGWIIKVKETNKEILIKGDSEND